jgi:hypothetical protein
MAVSRAGWICGTFGGKYEMNIFQRIYAKWNVKIESWLTLPTANHHLEHMGVGALVFLIALVSGATWEQSAWIAVAFGVIKEIADLFTGESWRSAICDMSQYAMTAPLALLYYGNWMLAVAAWIGLLGLYFYTLLYEV